MVNLGALQSFCRSSKGWPENQCAFCVYKFEVHINYLCIWSTARSHPTPSYFAKL